MLKSCTPPANIEIKSRPWADDRIYDGVVQWHFSVLGATGAAGRDGNTGVPGQTGGTGTPGRNGKDGTTGATGDQGLTGASGARGPQGDRGPLGGWLGV